MNNTATIGQRINSALALRNKKQKELASVLGVTDNTVSYFVGGKRTPNTEQITAIADFLNVSTDYLLGLNANPTTNEIEAQITKYTGLSAKSIETLRKAPDGLLEMLNFLLSNLNVLSLINHYFSSFVYSEIENNEKYRSIPRFLILEEETNCKLAFADLIESLPIERERYINSLSTEEKEAKVLNYLFGTADINKCKSELLGDKYLTPNEENNPLMLGLDDDTVLTKICYYDFQKPIDPQKKNEAIAWFLSEYEKKENNCADD